MILKCADCTKEELDYLIKPDTNQSSLVEATTKDVSDPNKVDSKKAAASAPEKLNAKETNVPSSTENETPKEEETAIILFKICHHCSKPLCDNHAKKVWDSAFSIMCHHCGKPLCDKHTRADSAFSNSDDRFPWAYHCTKCRERYHARVNYMELLARLLLRLKIW